MQPDFLFDVENIPVHWIGFEKDWLTKHSCLSDSMVSLPIDQQKLHCYLTGSTGSGKTTALHHCMAQDIMLGHSFVVLDMRGDLVTAALELCSRAVEPEKVLLYDLREKVRPFGFSPLAGAGEAPFKALGVLDAVAGESESWGVQLSESLRNALLLLAEANAPLTNIEAIFYDAAYRNSLYSVNCSLSVLEFWSRFDDLSPEKQNALAMPVLNKVSLLFSSEALRKILGHPKPADLGRHLDTPGSICLISLAVDELHSAGRMMGNIMLASLCREIFGRVNQPESQRNPVRLYVDEFENFRMDLFESILAEGRKYGLRLILAHQTLAQLTPRVRSMILNNVGTKLVFRTGRDDGQILSKDLTGDPKAYDFYSFAIGEAVLRKPDRTLTHVEINEPIVRDGGYVSDETAEFIESVKQLAPEYIDTTPSFKRSHDDFRTKPENRSGKSFPTSLEDWL